MKYIPIVLAIVILLAGCGPDSPSTTHVTTEEGCYKIETIDSNAHTALVTNTKTGEAYTVGPDGINHPVESHVK